MMVKAAKRSELPFVIVPEARQMESYFTHDGQFTDRDERHRITKE
jgi:hypothetical protein